MVLAWHSASCAPAEVDLPAETEGIRAVFWSDPCFSSKWIHCARGPELRHPFFLFFLLFLLTLPAPQAYADKFQTFPRSIAMLNAIYAVAWQARC